MSAKRHRPYTLDDFMKAIGLQHDAAGAHAEQFARDLSRLVFCDSQYVRLWIDLKDLGYDLESTHVRQAWIEHNGVRLQARHCLYRRLSGRRLAANFPSSLSFYKSYKTPPGDRVMFNHQNAHLSHRMLGSAVCRQWCLFLLNNRP